MSQLETLAPALGAAGQGNIHGWWWVILAVMVFALVTPLAYLLGRNGGKPLRR
jgi:CDP-diglyceride synthetase